MNKGMAIPYPEEGTGRTAVMTFISAQGTPIARRFEMWALDAEHDAMVLQAGTTRPPRPKRVAAAPPSSPCRP